MIRFPASRRMIAAEHGVEQHRIAHITKAHGIRPIARIGNTNVYDEGAVRRIEAELARIRAQKQCAEVQEVAR